VRVGLVTDVHSHAAELARALSLFREQGVDRVVTIGDTIDAFAPTLDAAQVAEMLLGANAVGVWGNHDFGLRGQVAEATRARLPLDVFEFMERMQPRLVLEDCHFSHRESYVDPFDVSQLWDLSEHRLPLEEKASLAFKAVVQRWQFTGHYHRWFAATPSGSVAWDGAQELEFDPDLRYFVVVAAVCDGWCAILDLQRHLLQPLSCAGA